MLLDIKWQELLVSKESFCSGRMHECFEILKRRFQHFKPEGKKALRKLLQIHYLEHKSIILGLGNPSLSDEYALKLPGGLERLHRHFTKLSGLFSPATKKRGKWATSWIMDLANRRKGVANGIAYELLASERILMENLLGLDIVSSDYCSFCFKLQASYPGSEEYLKGQPRRGTVESDLQIFISKQQLEVGIDFKYTQNRRPIRLSSQQIAGLASALKTGEIDQFWFVSNYLFSKSSHALVKSLNKEMTISEISFDKKLITSLLGKLGIKQEEFSRYASPLRKIGLLEGVQV